MIFYDFSRFIGLFHLCPGETNYEKDSKLAFFGRLLITPIFYWS